MVENIKVESEGAVYHLNVDVNYRLSPTAKEALQKGISLTWIVIIKVKRQGVLWDTTVQEFEMVYQIQNHALLNLYSVKKIQEGSSEFFSTLRAALNSISKIRGLSVIDKSSMLPGQGYHIALKVLFSREALPIPLRPVSYFDSQWALSSPWILWQLQN
jgi:hypothetical protein